MFDRVWYRDPAVLLKRPLEFFPTRDMTPAERLNSITRFVIYASSGIAAYRQDATVLGIGAIVVIVLALVFSARSGKDTVTGEDIKEDGKIGERQKCRPPTPENPFMNVLADEYGDSAMPGACPVTSSTLKRSNDYFGQGLPREISDVYHNRASDRQFVTMPASGKNGVPDTLAFRNYLFSETVKGPKCK